ncbi:MAG: hypothetical protein QW279_05515 [Candidatus Jordarchaeaceae archaeon]
MVRRYLLSRNRVKSQILQEFQALARYNLCYASFLLSHCGKKIIKMGANGQRVIISGEVMKIRRRRKMISDEFKKVLVWLGEILDYS